MVARLVFVALIINPASRNSNEPTLKRESARSFEITMSIHVERWSRDFPLNPQELKSRLLDEGYGVFQWSDAPGTRYGPHAHAEDQSHWIVSGELALVVGHETYTLRAGDRRFPSREYDPLGLCSR